MNLLQLTLTFGAIIHWIPRAHTGLTLFFFFFFAIEGVLAVLPHCPVTCMIESEGVITCDLAFLPLICFLHIAI